MKYFGRASNPHGKGKCTPIREDVIRREDMAASWMKYKEQHGEMVDAVSFLDQFLSPFMGQQHSRPPQDMHQSPSHVTQHYPTPPLSSPNPHHDSLGEWKPLYVPWGDKGELKLAGYGVVMTGHDKVHRKKLTVEQVCVCIRKVVAGFVPIEFPPDKQTMSLMKQVENTFVAWRKEHIGPLDNLKDSNQACKFQESMDALQARLSVAFPKSDDKVSIPISLEVGGVAETADFESSDVIDLLSNEWLAESWIQIGLLDLYEKCNELGRSDIKFITPTQINLDTDEKVMFECVSRKIGRIGSQVIFAPINTGRHWVLVMIFTENALAFVCDSKNEDVEIALPEELRKRITKAFCNMREEKLTWSTMTVPKQRSDWECAYYVLRYMFEIVTQVDNVSDIIAKFSLNPYTKYEINEIRSLLADRVMPYLSRQLD